MMEDIRLLARNPGIALKTVATARQKVKFYNHLSEIIFNQPYYWLYSIARPNTTLIDIGAFIGDTAAYFAMNPNIDRIIAYEPHPNTFKILSENIKAMPQQISSKITLKNVAITDEKGYVSNNMKEITGTNKTAKSKKGIRSTTLKDELEGISNIAIKSDCEGGEYRIFRNTEDLNNVYAIQMEYHMGYSALEEVLNRGAFNCVHSPDGELGYLTALRG
ncbi:MAG: FkbM family methyltransferase [Candidatus Marsarchaeota archaeon]|nr:FkbM family methyltransferase [Candidatus Marsarchaeota archaeon]MCL5413329.1 FkbM family methyltransferase [Candidatus Marsarchaeota archaeon]